MHGDPRDAAGLPPPASGSNGRQSPERAEGVPDDARWNPDAHSWWSGPLDAQSQPHGVRQVHRVDGSLEMELTYYHGTLEGPFRRFHPNGDVSRRGRYRAGQLDGEVVAFASEAPSPETLRACCVPPGAVTLHAEYVAGSCRSEHFYDARRRLLLEDGSLHPDRPESVPAEARFDLRQQRWVHGTYGPRGKDGRFEWYDRGGQLVELADFEDGQRHGDWQRYESGRLRFRCEQVHGVPHGVFFERVEPGRHSDESIAERRGQLDRGRHVGVWRYRTDGGQLVAEVDHGLPVESVSAEHPALSSAAHGTPSAEHRDVDADVLQAVARGLDGSGQHALAFLVELRLAALRGVEAPQRCPRLDDRASRTLIRRRTDDPSELEQKLSGLAAALLEGADPSSVLRQMASVLVRSPRQALALSDAAVYLDQRSTSARITRALALLDLGWVEHARRDAQWLEVTSPGSSRALSIAELFPSFEFWPAQTTLLERAMEELPTTVAQDIRSLRRAIAKCALRLESLRDALRDVCHSNEQHWFPPDLSELARAEPVELESYSFVTDEAEEPDTVLVQERLRLDGHGVTALMWQARREWTLLCWLCWSAGLQHVAQPDQLAPPTSFALALTTAFARHWTAADRVQTFGLRARTSNIPAFEWEGTSVDELTLEQAMLARDEYLEMRAALFFAGDGTCRSPWQDDLRDPG